jgi:uncharacterized protein (TIGR02186 family)
VRAGLAAMAAVALALLSGPASAQPADTVQRAEQPLQTETFEIGLSTETIAVGANFGGARLVVFGALDNADQRLLRQGRYDIAVILEGPRRDLVVREKSRVFGIWINSRSERFRAVPQSYSAAATRPLRDIASAETLRQFGIGIENLAFSPLRPPTGLLDERADFSGALRRLKTQSGLFADEVGTVEFVSPTLFRANLVLPADLPVGRHVARAFLFREGVYLRERDEDVWVLKTGIESRISAFAAENGVLYGVLAVFVAILTGWLGRLAFKRD